MGTETFTCKDKSCRKVLHSDMDDKDLMMCCICDRGYFCEDCATPCCCGGRQGICDDCYSSSKYECAICEDTSCKLQDDGLRCNFCHKYFHEACKPFETEDHEAAGLCVQCANDWSRLECNCNVGDGYIERTFCVVCKRRCCHQCFPQNAENKEEDDDEEEPTVVCNECRANAKCSGCNKSLDAYDMMRCACCEAVKCTSCVDRHTRLCSTCVCGCDGCQEKTSAECCRCHKHVCEAHLQYAVKLDASHHLCQPCLEHIVKDALAF